MDDAEPLIDLQSDAYFMDEALRQARRALARDEVPVGAVVVRNGRIIARAFNQVETWKDATAHAEMLALTQAQAAVGDWLWSQGRLAAVGGAYEASQGAAVGRDGQVQVSSSAEGRIRVGGRCCALIRGAVEL